jgi:hypothetical protein
MTDKTVFNQAVDNKIKIYNPRYSIIFDKDNDMVVLLLTNYNIKLFFNKDSFDELLERLKNYRY